MKKLLLIMSVLFLGVGGCCRFSAEAVHWLITASFSKPLDQIAEIVRATPTPTPTLKPTQTPVPTPTKNRESVFSGKVFDDLETAVEAITAERIATAPAYVESIEIRLLPERYWETSTRRTKNVKIEETVYIKGIPIDNPFVGTGDYMFRSDYEGGWYLDGEVDYGETTPFWTLYTTFVDTEHFILISSVGREETVNAIAPFAEAAYANLQAKAFTLDDKYVVYYAPDRDMFQSVTSYDTYAGAANYRYTSETDNKSTARAVTVNGHRFDPPPIDDQLLTINRAVYINGHRFDPFPVDDQLQIDRVENTIQHEIVHLIVSHASRDITPVWLVEGIAVYHSRPQLADYTHQCEVINLTDLTNTDFLTREEYTCVGLLYAYLVRTYGEETVLTLYGRFTEVEFDDDNYAEQRAESTPLFVEEELGIPMAQLETNFVLSLDE